MKKIILETKRPWNWKVFLLLLGLIMPAAFAIVPYSLHLLTTFNESIASTPRWEIIFRNALINGLIVSVMGGAGLILANRLGLGLPFVEGWVKREPVPHRFHGAIAIGWIAGVGFALSILLLQNAVFGPPMLALFEEIGYTTPEEAVTPPLYGFLAAFSAGITEEIFFRLFGLSLLAWLGGLLFHDFDGRPKLAVLWTANIVFAIAFGAAHLPTAASLGWPINTLVVTRTLVLNGIGGLVLGWLFWTFGLETAMLAHFFGDVIIYTLLPIIALQDSESGKYFVLAAVLILVLLLFVWSWRYLIVENRRDREQSEKTPNKKVFPVVREANNQTNHAISIQNLTKDFDTVRALDSLSFEVPSGTIFGFLGPNGAGKTTTIRLLLGLLEPSSGDARVLGFDTRSQADQIRARTGALLEHTGIYEQMSAENNLTFYARAFCVPEAERRARIQELLTHMGLWERRKDQAGNWSRGMKQKLALARTLLHRPRLILLDEPTAGLDVQSAVAIREDLEALVSQEDVTIFLTTHNMVDAEKLCHQVAVIRDGRLVAVGSPEKLKAQASSPRLEIKGRGFHHAALESLRAHPQVGNMQIQNGHLVINLLSETDPAPLVSILVGAGAHVEEVHRSKASLEDIFLLLTGEQKDE
jgi:ABC-2 type transport system ATP-binding protein